MEPAVNAVGVPSSPELAPVIASTFPLTLPAGSRHRARCKSKRILRGPVPAKWCRSSASISVDLPTPDVPSMSHAWNGAK